MISNNCHISHLLFCDVVPEWKYFEMYTQIFSLSQIKSNQFCRHTVHVCVKSLTRFELNKKCMEEFWSWSSPSTFGFGWMNQPIQYTFNMSTDKSKAVLEEELLCVPLSGLLWCSLKVFFFMAKMEQKQDRLRVRKRTKEVM